MKAFGINITFFHTDHNQNGGQHGVLSSGCLEDWHFVENSVIE